MENYLDLVNEQITKEENEHIEGLENLKRLREMSKNIYRTGFADALTIVGILDVDGSFKFNEEINECIYKKMSVEDIRKMTNILKGDVR